MKQGGYHHTSSKNRMGDPSQDGLSEETQTDKNEEFIATVVSKPQDGFGSKYGCAAHFLFLFKDRVQDVQLKYSPNLDQYCTVIAVGVVT